MDLTTDITISIVSCHCLMLDATHIAGERLKIQNKIWSMAKKCQDSHAFFDVVPAMNSLTVYLKNPSAIHDWRLTLHTWWQAIDEIHYTGTHHKIITEYGKKNGPDLEFVANAHGLSTAEVIKLHTSAHYHVLFLGFQPGFTYLHGLPTALITPRKDKPRTHVAKGSVAIGADQTGIYPADSPGGWHIIGHTDFSLFNSNNNPPSVIKPGDTLQFVSKEQLV